MDLKDYNLTVAGEVNIRFLSYKDLLSIKEMNEIFDDPYIDIQQWKLPMFSLIDLYNNTIPNKILVSTYLKQEIRDAIKTNNINVIKIIYSTIYTELSKYNRQSLLNRKKITTTFKEKPFEVWNVDTKSIERDRKKKPAKAKSKRKVKKCGCKK